MTNRRARSARRVTLGLVVGAGLAFATTAHAEASEALAPAGPCAEPRLEVRAQPIELRGGPIVRGDTFDVSGAPQHHFDPRDVAADDEGRGFDAPSPRGFARTACDSPDAGCVGILTPGPPLVESDATSGCPPGASCP